MPWVSEGSTTQELTSSEYIVKVMVLTGTQDCFQFVLTSDLVLLINSSRENLRCKYAGKMVLGCKKYIFNEAVVCSMCTTLSRQFIKHIVVAQNAESNLSELFKYATYLIMTW